MSTTTTKPTVPTVTVHQFSTEYRVVIARADVTQHTIFRPPYNTTKSICEALAAEIRGALADAYLAGQADGVQAARLTAAPATEARIRRVEPTKLTRAQDLALLLLCERRDCTFDPTSFTRGGLPEGWVGGWIGTSPTDLHAVYVVLDADGIVQPS